MKSSIKQNYISLLFFIPSLLGFLGIASYSTVYGWSLDARRDPIFSVTSMAHIVLQKIEVVSQINEIGQQIGVQGIFAKDMQWYLAGQTFGQTKTLRGCTIGLRGASFFGAYHMQSIASRYKRIFQVGWLKPLSQIGSRGNVSIKIPSRLGWRLLEQQIALESEELSTKSDAGDEKERVSPIISFRSLLSAQIPDSIQSELGLTAESIHWHPVKRYLSIVSPVVELDLLAKLIDTFPWDHIRSVQVCTESLRVPTHFKFPCSLEICYRPSKLHALEMSAANPSVVNQMQLNNCRIHGDLAWYSPYHELSLKGKTRIAGDAFFQVQAMRLRIAASLQVGGSLGIFTKLPKQINPCYANGLTGLILESTSLLTAKQSFMCLNQFYNAFNARISFVNGGVVLIETEEEIPKRPPVFQFVPEGFLASVQLDQNDADRYWRRSTFKASHKTDRGAYVTYSAFFTPTVLSPSLPNSAQEGSLGCLNQDLGREIWFGQHRRKYYQSTVMPIDLGEMLHELSNGWNLLRSIDILSIFAEISTQRAGHFVCKDGNESAACNYSPGYGLALTLRDGGLPLDLQRKKAALIFLGWHDLYSSKNFAENFKQLECRVVDGSKFIIELVEHCSESDFIPHGIRKIYVLHDRLTQKTYQAACHCWKKLSNSFFNESTFQQLLGPFLAYYPN